MKRSRILMLLAVVAAAAVGGSALWSSWHVAGSARSSAPVSVQAAPSAARAAPELAKSADTVSSATAEHAVILHLPLSAKGFGTKSDVEDCQKLEQELEKAIARAGVGEMDGNEIGDGECTLFMYGPNADKLFGTIARRARSSRLGKGGWGIKRYGSADEPHVREVRVDL